jgi:predicted Fe-Mo cluster-binding NifX family protein
MIAIPVEFDSNNTVALSKLFGNAVSFALYDTVSNKLTVTKNEGCGNGIATADFLLSKGVKSALYTYLGDGPFYTLVRGGAKVYYMGKSPTYLDETIRSALNGELTEVTPENAKTYLDPGTASDACECGCSHD